ncbi:MAG: annexin [Candidatus Gastranaerophilales bacterium]|nr:annexin [Candidatus Gastranaerophilales bacterium]
MGENFSLNGVNQNWLEKKDYYSKIKDVVEQEGLLDDGELTADEIKEYFSPEKAETDEAKKANAQLISDFLNEFEMSDEEYFEFVGNVESETEAQQTADMEETSKNADKPDNEYTKYWGNGNVKEHIVFNEDGTLQSHRKFDYNGKEIFSSTEKTDNKQPVPEATPQDGSKPTTDTPATDTPATDTPATDTPATDTPATDTPTTEKTPTETPTEETTSKDEVKEEETTEEKEFIPEKQEVISDREAKLYAEKLHDAVDGWGTDEQAFKEVMQDLDGANLLKVAQIYEKEFGESLEEAIKDDFSGADENTYLGQLKGAQEQAKSEGQPLITKEDAALYADQIHEAIDGWGTDEEKVSELINSLRPEDLQVVSMVYEEEYGESLEEAIKGDFSGDEEDVLLDKLSDAQKAEIPEGAIKEENEGPISDRTAKLYAEKLHDAIDGWGTDEEAVEKVMGRLEGADLVKVAQIYEQEYGESLEEAIKGDFSGADENTYVGLIKGAQEQAANEGQPELNEKEAELYADKIHDAIGGWGTNEEKVATVIGALNDKDMVAVADAYEEKYGESLEEAIKGDFSGDEEDVLLTKLERAREGAEELEEAEKEETEEA